MCSSLICLLVYFGSVWLLGLLLFALLCFACLVALLCFALLAWFALFACFALLCNGVRCLTWSVSLGPAWLDSARLGLAWQAR